MRFTALDRLPIELLYPIKQRATAELKARQSPGLSTSVAVHPEEIRDPLFLECTAD
jgi:hypothetical protein